MRILIVSTHYAPEEAGNAPYVTGLANYLVEIGHEAIVFAGMPYYPQWRIRSGYHRRLWQTEHLNGVVIHRRRQYIPSQPSTTGRALFELSRLATGSTFRSKPADAVVGVVPTISDGLLAASAARGSSVPYGIVFQDLVAVGAAESGIAGKRTSAAIQVLERRIVSRASGVGIVAEGYRPHIEALGVPPSRIRRLYNWDRSSTPSKDPNEIRRLLDISPSAVLCLHAGNMGAKQGLENIIECARLAEVHSPNLTFCLLGDGSQRAALTSLADEYHLQNVRFMDPQPDGVYSTALRAADILILNQRGSLVDMALPSKLTAYFAASRPIVAAINDNSEAASQIRESASGVICKPENPFALLRSLSDLADAPEMRAKLGASGSDFGKEHLSQEIVLPQWASFVDSIHRAPTP